MQITSPLSFTWLIFLLATVAVMVCRSLLAQRETDQLFLNDELRVSQNQREHRQLLRLLDALRPAYQILGGATLAISAVIATMYVIELWPYVHLFQ